MHIIRIYRRGYSLIASFSGLDAEWLARASGYPENNEYLWLR